MYASNVVNVQPTVSDLVRTLDTIKACVRPGGVFFCNFPLMPRKCNVDLTNEDITALLVPVAPYFYNNNYIISDCI